MGVLRQDDGGGGGGGGRKLRVGVVDVRFFCLMAGV